MNEKTFSLIEKFTPWIITAIVIIIIFPYQSINNFFGSPEPKIIHVPQYIYLPQQEQQNIKHQEQQNVKQQEQQNVKQQEQQNVKQQEQYNVKRQEQYNVKQQEQPYKNEIGIVNMNSIKICIFILENMFNSEYIESCVNLCKKYNCKIAIMASRSPQGEINFSKFGIVEPYFLPQDLFIPQEILSSFEDVSQNRLNNIKTLQEKYKTINSNIIYIDDNHYNINLIKENNYNVIDISDTNSSIQMKHIIELEKLLKLN